MELRFKKDEFVPIVEHGINAMVAKSPLKVMSVEPARDMGRNDFVVEVEFDKVEPDQNKNV